MVREVIRHEDEFYILASSPRIDDRTSVLKQGETFAVFDRYGDADPFGGGELGIFHGGTRFLSRLALRLFDKRPLLLSSTVKEENDLMAIDLTNLDVQVDERTLVPRGTLHVFRSRFLWEGSFHERLRIRNYATGPVEIPMQIRFDADFADIFEVRGHRRERRGRRLEDEIAESSILLRYEGLDGVLRRTRLSWSPAPAELESGGARFTIGLAPHDEAVVFMTVDCEVANEPRSRAAVPTYDLALRRSTESLQRTAGRSARVYTSNEQFNEWLFRSGADLHMMFTETRSGLYPYAGVPWFSTAFGRDGIITALECLWLNPDVAGGVLRYLAATQAEENDRERDAEPGKILHETRRGEMAALKEIPFGTYYGTVDATPLFVLLASEYHRWTGDRALIERIWPNIERALEWIDTHGDVDGDGFVEYERKSAHGLVNQGWKDSKDSVFHADGRLAEPPIALCEVQGYVYAAKRGAAELSLALGAKDRAKKLLREAETLRVRFEEAFWCDDLQTYALALDGAKRACRVRSSNAGHCLFTRIASPERAALIATTLLSDACFSGWGIRTLANNEARYNPMSYHNGSVWPHDNALIAAGIGEYGLKEPVARILTGLFDASIFVDQHRMPELYCGFPRRPGEGPTLYPLACAPQSWAAAAVFLLLRATLGMSVHGEKSQLRFLRPSLPASLQRVELRNLRVGRGEVDVVIERYAQDAGVNVTRREGPVEVLIFK